MKQRKESESISSLAKPVVMGRVEPIQERDLSETDNGHIERCEVTMKLRADAAGVIRAESSYGATDDCVGGERKDVVSVNGIEKLGADSLTNSHGEMIFNLDRKRRPSREDSGIYL